MPSPRSLYVFPPAYSLQNPAETARVERNARALCSALNWTPFFSSLLSRYPGPGAWVGVGERNAELRKALEHDAIWACRGGFGSIHLVPELLAQPVSHSTLLLGYSDVTILHSCWKQQQRGRGIYATLPDALEHSRTGSSLLALLRGEPWRRDGKMDDSVRVLRTGNATGVSFAACITVLAALNGTPASPNLDGTILFLEDIDERPYKIDFALNTLYLAGKLNGIRALIGGSFKHQNPSDYWGPSLEDILQTWGERLNIPVLARLPFGHWDDPLAVPIGTRVELSAASNSDWCVRTCEPLTA